MERDGSTSCAVQSCHVTLAIAYASLERCVLWALTMASHVSSPVLAFSCLSCILWPLPLSTGLFSGVAIGALAVLDPYDPICQLVPLSVPSDGNVCNVYIKRHQE